MTGNVHGSTTYHQPNDFIWLAESLLIRRPSLGHFSDVSDTSAEPQEFRFDLLRPGRAETRERLAAELAGDY
jgi:hypothetical protein